MQKNKKKNHDISKRCWFWCVRYRRSTKRSTLSNGPWKGDVDFGLSYRYWIYDHSPPCLIDQSWREAHCWNALLPQFDTKATIQTDTISYSEATIINSDIVYEVGNFSKLTKTNIGKPSFQNFSTTRESNFALLATWLTLLEHYLQSKHARDAKWRGDVMLVNEILIIVHLFFETRRGETLLDYSTKK